MMMEWNWENLVGFEPKAIESPKKLRLGADWIIGADGVVGGGSFNLSAGGGNSGVSGSDGGHVSSSAKSSISASTDSSLKDGMLTSSGFRFMTLECFAGNLNDKMEMKGTSNVESPVGSVEPLIGLKLGKRTYFKNTSSGSNVGNASFLPAAPSSSKKNKSPGQNFPAPRCLVEGCNVDLSNAKGYHRKHKVCECHSKSSTVIVAGLERRFCQQCSRFHGLDEFDGKKRSCRRRLSDHNARRRKPQQGAIQFNPAAFYDGRGQIGFLPNSVPHIPSTSPSRFTVTTAMRGYPFKSNGDELAGIKLQHFSNMQDNLFLASKSYMSDVSNSGDCKGSWLMSSHIDDGASAASQYSCALSLLSSSSVPHQQPQQQHYHNENGMMYQQTLIPDGASEYWGRMGGGANRTPGPYELADLYSNMLN